MTATTPRETGARGADDLVTGVLAALTSVRIAGETVATAWAG